MTQQVYGLFVDFWDMSTIRIRTAQNVLIDYTLATVMERAIAFLLDVMIYGIGYLIFLFGVNQLIGDRVFSSSNLEFFWLAMFPVSGLLLYLFISEWLGSGQTPGKRLVGLKVVRQDGRPPSILEYMLRAVFQLVDTLFTLGTLAALLISTTDRRQRLGDLTSNTTVIKVKTRNRFSLEDILTIESIETHQITYPQVTQIAEHDMLLLKETINRWNAYPTPGHRQAILELADRMGTLLDIQVPDEKHTNFLRTLLRDYIVLTR